MVTNLNPPIYDETKLVFLTFVGRKMKFAKKSIVFKIQEYITYLPKENFHFHHEFQIYREEKVDEYYLWNEMVAFLEHFDT